jgi:hypothetical protein
MQGIQKRHRVVPAMLYLYTSIPLYLYPMHYPNQIMQSKIHLLLSNLDPPLELDFEDPSLSPTP